MLNSDLKVSIYWPHLKNYTEYAKYTIISKIKQQKSLCDLPHLPSIQNLSPASLNTAMKLSSTVTEQHSNMLK